MSDFPHRTALIVDRKAYTLPISSSMALYDQRSVRSAAMRPMLDPDAFAQTAAAAQRVVVRG
jgi:hypothetical protein